MIVRTIFFNPAGRVRAGWRVLVFSALVLTLGPLGGVLLSVAFPTSRASGAGAQMLVYIGLIGATLLASAICLRWLDRRPFRSLGYQWRRHGWREYLLGLGLAALMITLLVLIQLPLGHVRLQLEERSVTETASGTVLAFLFFNVAAAFEEFLFRGYLLQTLLLDVRPTIAVSVPSVLFGLGHAGNPGASGLSIFNTVLAGIWLSIAYLKTQRLWLPIGLHAGWNFTMSAIYGLTVSGIEEQIGASLFRAAQTGPTWLTGGSYGPEGGVLVTGLLIGASLWLWRTPGLRPHEEMPEASFET